MGTDAPQNQAAPRTQRSSSACSSRCSCSRVVGGRARLVDRAALVPHHERQHRRARARRATVTVYRDDAGIPQLVAETDHDLFFAQGYVHAQDRFWEMDFRRHVTAGRLAELFGESQVGTDAFIRTLDWRGIAEQEYDAARRPALEAYYDAYADGVNAYLAERSGADLSLEYAVLGLQNPGYSPEPWSRVDSIAWLKAMAWDLRSNLGDEIDRAMLADGAAPRGGRPAPPGVSLRARCPRSSAGARGAAAAAVDDARSAGRASATADRTAVRGIRRPRPTASPTRSPRSRAAIDGVPELLGPEGGDLGSNSWVVGGALTESGLPLLANDPHLGPAMPSIWTQMGLHCAEVARDLRLRRRRLHVLGPARRHHRPQRPHRLGVHEPRPRRRRPVPRARRRRHLRARRRAGAAHDPRGDHRGRRRRPRHDHGALDGARPDRHRHPRRLRRRRRRSTPRHPGQPDGDYERVAAVDRAHAGHARRRPIFALDRAQDWNGLPRGRRRSSTCPRRTSSTPTSTATSATRRPARIPVRTSGDGTRAAARLDERERLGGHDPLRRAALGAEPARGLHRHREQRRQPDPTARCSRRTGTTATAPRASTG